VLAGVFAYVDAVVTDTPILDDNYRRMIGNATDITSRLRRVELFRVYLDRQWRVLADGVEGLTFNWEDHSRGLRKDVETVERKTKRP
jgi:hypothetical protein